MYDSHGPRNLLSEHNTYRKQKHDCTSNVTNPGELHHDDCARKRRNKHPFFP